MLEFGKDNPPCPLLCPIRLQRSQACCDEIVVDELEATYFIGQVVPGEGSLPRTIHVPTVLMAELWRYKTIDRPSLAQRAELEAETLFVTRDGLTYDDRGLVTVFHRLTQRVGFHVSAHMLRHTYATYTLHALRAARVSFDPLLYVRDRLGHSSVLTTERYLHYLAEVEDDLMTRYQEEIDAVLQEAL